MSNQPETTNVNKPRRSFRKRMFARWYDQVMATYEEYIAERKRELFASLSGSVMEIGPGTGANLAYVPEGSRWIGIEPNHYMHDQLREKAGKHDIEAEFAVASAEGIAVDDETIDCVVCTLVLCSVTDPSQVLAEVKRVLRPGGRFYFIEHVAAPKKTWLRFSQGVIRPVWRFCADGCCPDRETGVTIDRAGFGLVEMKNFRVPREI
ncbi:MAG: class I SAM-dependent methyltransferase, partial [Pirellulaceae bacterium]|nr:class I SAM-dependent methyltransferase [Pirellulaceae bacterium]